MRNPTATAPVRGMRPVIHRNGTFEWRGSTYWIVYHGPDYGYEVMTWPKGIYVADNLFTLAEIRDYVVEFMTDERNADA